MICRRSSGGRDWMISGAKFCTCSSNSCCSWSNFSIRSFDTPYRIVVAIRVSHYRLDTIRWHPKRNLQSRWQERVPMPYALWSCQAEAAPEQQHEPILGDLEEDVFSRLGRFHCIVLAGIQARTHPATGKSFTLVASTFIFVALHETCHPSSWIKFTLYINLYK